MRISSRTIVDHVLVNLQRNFTRLDRLQNQLSSGKRIQFPSDDPAGATTAMRLHTAALDNQQYLKNVDAAISWLESTDKALQDVVSSLHRARELTINAARGDLPDQARSAIADELDQIIRHIVQIANTQQAGRYVFGGTQTVMPAGVSEPLYKPLPSGAYVTRIEFRGNALPFNYEVGPEMDQQVNVLGTEAFGHPPGTPSSPAIIDSTNGGLFGILIRVRDHAKDPARIGDLSGTDLQELDRALDRVLESLNQVGARQEGLKLLRQRLTSQEVNLADLLSRTEDLDVPKAIMELKMQENVYRLALASGARVIQPTLLDFLR